jgi:Co/Zn/Cd efflux system component
MGFGGHGLHGHSHDSNDHGHSHDHDKRKYSCSKTIRLSSMLILTFTFCIVELVSGHITNSLTLIADSFHMLSDVIALCIGLVSVRVCCCCCFWSQKDYSREKKFYF